MIIFLLILIACGVLLGREVTFGLLALTFYLAIAAGVLFAIVLALSMAFG